MSQLMLAEQLSQRVQQVCIGLEHGVADILDMVTPTTAELLKFWFLDSYCQIRRFNFHQGQKQAILNTIYAHEVLGITNLKELYQEVSPDELLTGERLHEVSQVKHQHPKYCLKMATGTGKTWVLQALLVWQLLNKNASPDDKRFSRYFMLVAPGLIVYDRLLDAFCGKIKHGERDFNSSDVAIYAELFTPETCREQVFSFVRHNVCDKENIGLKAVGGGMVAICNWHLLMDVDDAAEETEVSAQGADLDPMQVLQDLLPLSPGKSAGNSLEVLDKRYARGNVLEYLANLRELVVFNDEAHHIHDIKAGGEASEVEWQKSLSRIAANKGRQFVQVDFSATPYNDIGSGKNKRKLYFPHIIVDFDLKTAMRLGLVKSLVLDRRKEIGALPLEFKAERDESGNPQLAEGQRVMLRAGLAKLRKLEQDFAQIDPTRHPKMLVVCEDTTVSPLVAQFLYGEGLAEDEVMAIDSGKKAELKPDDWAVVRERLFDVDKHAKPRVIVSVLMLREGCPLPLYCTPSVEEDLRLALPLLPALTHWRGGFNVHHLPEDGITPFSIDALPGLSWRAIPLPSNAPPFSPRRDAPRPGDNIGLLITNQHSGKTLFYAPGLAHITAAVRQCLQQADCLMVDGTFWTNDEMARLGLGDKTALAMGHMPQSGADGMINALQGVVGRKILIHINNTNPILDEDSPERRELAMAGIEVAFDGMMVNLC